MIWQRWVIGAAAVALLSGCNTWQAYQAAVDRKCREQSKNNTARYNDCLRKAAAADRQRLRHQDEAWLDSIYDAGRYPVVVVPVRPQPPYHR